MKILVDNMKKAGKTTYLEVVTYTEEECMNAAKLAVECGFDCLMGTLYYPSVGEMVKGKIQYFPFCGKVWDNPSKLGGTNEEIIADAHKLQVLGCEGTDLLAFRHVNDPISLLEDFIESVNFPTVVAGSIDSYERINYMNQLKPYGITMGSALFAKKFVPEGSFYDNLKAVSEYMENLL